MHKGFSVCVKLIDSIEPKSASYKTATTSSFWQGCMDFDTAAISGHEGTVTIYKLNF